MNKSEQREKRARIKALLIEKGLEAVVLRKGANVAWIIGGRAHIPTTLELSCMDVIVYPDRIVVVTNKIEAQRLKDEELSGDEELNVVNWFEGRDAQLPKGPKIGVDGVDSERINIQSEIENLRRKLNEFEVARLKEIGRDATEALEEAMLDIDSDASEVEVAGEIAEELWSAISSRSYSLLPEKIASRSIAIRFPQLLTWEIWLWELFVPDGKG